MHFHSDMVYWQVTGINNPLKERPRGTRTLENFFMVVSVWKEERLVVISMKGLGRCRREREGG